MEEAVVASSPIWASRPKTRGLVLDLIRAARTISRVELAAATGLTGATISEVVRELMGDGLVVEAGRGAPTGGKPRTMVQLNPLARYSVGVQLERNTCVIVVVDLAGRQVARTSFQGVATMPPQQALPLVASQVDALLAAAAVDPDKVLGVGLVSYGPQDRRAGVLLTPQPTDEWFGYPVARRLSESLGLPVLLDNDAAAAAIGEYWMGAVDPRSTYGCIYMATGIGGGVVVAGEVYRGSSSNSVEIGHISIDVNGDDCPCGNVGCLENYAGPSAVVRQALTEPGLAQRLGLDPGGGRERWRTSGSGLDRTVGPVSGLCRRHHDLPFRSRRDRVGRAELRRGRCDLPVAGPAGGGPSHVRPACASGAGGAVGQWIGRGRDRRGRPRPAERAHRRRPCPPGGQRAP
jgi:predicted NBD/HSP70 family sugar kinase